MTRMKLVGGLTVVLVTAAGLRAADQEGIPKEALEAMQYMVGDWEVDGHENNQRMTGSVTYRWVPGKHCLTWDMVLTDPKGTYLGSAIVAWDPARRQLVERDFWPRGSWNTYCYTIGTDQWTGEAVQVGADGAVSKGKISQENRGPNEFVWRLFDTADAAGKPGSVSELRFRKVQPGPAYEHLKFLEPLVGNWKVVTTEGDKTTSVGEESSQWVLNKSFMRHVGWGQIDGSPVQYEFYTGWNPKTKEVFQWAVGATETDYAILERLGAYDAAQRVWTSRESLQVSNGEYRTSLVTLKFVDDDTITMDVTERRMGDKTLPDAHTVFTRQSVFTPPETDDTPGPGYEQLKFLDFSVGKWKLEATTPGVGEYLGEEVNEWAFHKNFVRTKGWGRNAGEERIDYELLMGWDPAKKKVFMRFVGSRGEICTREGTYDPEKKCVKSRQTTVGPEGAESSATVEERYLDNDHFLLLFSDATKGGKPEPGWELKVTRIGH